MPSTLDSVNRERHNILHLFRAKVHKMENATAKVAAPVSDCEYVSFDNYVVASEAQSTSDVATELVGRGTTSRFEDTIVELVASHMHIGNRSCAASSAPELPSEAGTGATSFLSYSISVLALHWPKCARQL